MKRKLTQTKTITYIPGTTDKIRPTRCELQIGIVTIRVSFSCWAHTLNTEQIGMAAKWFASSLENLQEPDGLMSKRGEEP